MADVSNVQVILQSLVPALAYGARDDFAHLGTLRDVEQLIRSVAARLGQAGASAELAGELSRAAAGFDKADNAARRVALTSLARAIAPVLELPESLRRLVRGESAPAPRRAPAHVPPAPQPEPPALQPMEPLAMFTPPVARKRARTTTAERELFKEERPGVTEEKERRPSFPEMDLRGAHRSAETEVVYPSVSPSSGPLATPIDQVVPLRGRIVQALKDRKMTKVGEVLFFFPRTYEDRREPVPIARLKLGERGVSIGTVKLITETPAGGRKVFRLVLGDGTGTIAATWYHYQSWLKQRFKVGERYLFTGEVRAFRGIREVAHPEMEPADEIEAEAVNFGRIVPIYPGFERSEQRAFRAIVQKVAERFADAVSDPLPEAVRARTALPPLAQAIRQVHFPANGDVESLLAHALPAQRRLAFDELFFIQVGMALRRKGVRVSPGICFKLDPATRARALSRLPFALTHDQRKSLEEILADMARTEPMNRLLQGDVGSGKTAVAIVAALVAVENGYQAAFMAPTEILAEQHHRTLTAWLAKAGYRIALLTAGVSKKHKEEVKAAIASGEAQLVIGTHALLQEDVGFHKLGFVVIDEQHRFGVLQRARLMQKGVRPDVLVMTATPIPRTLSMTLYGDLDVSVIREMPPGRQPVKTRVFSERQREKVYELVASQLALGRQAFVVYPLVEESEKVDLESATEGAKKLAETFSKHVVGLIHGRMPVEEKDGVMRAFREGRIHVLVSTTVVEVGVDVPNATVMLVESAERFGLSQLHQLRGRVGRGSEKSYCFLIGAAWRNEAAMERLKAMGSTTDGFAIAEQDLKIRGPGEFLGTRQSGVPGLVVADLARDQDLLQLARDEARRLVDEDPRLEKKENALLRVTLDERWDGKLGLARVG